MHISIYQAVATDCNLKAGCECVHTAASCATWATRRNGLNRSAHDPGVCIALIPSSQHEPRRSREMVVSSAAGPVSAGPSCALREVSHQRVGPIGCSARAAIGAPSRVAGPFAAPLRHVGHFAQAQQLGSSMSQAQLPVCTLAYMCGSSASLAAQAPESVVPTLSCVCREQRRQSSPARRQQRCEGTRAVPASAQSAARRG